jgi:hypothetical protein
MRRHLMISIALATALAGCATWVDPGAEAPSAAVREALSPLAGHWQGTVWETASVYYQGSAALDVTIGDDGRWSGTIGRAEAHGTARMRGRWLVLSGTATQPDGHQDTIAYELTGDAHRRWGEVASGFYGRDGQGRVEHAEVSLTRMP